MTNAFVAGLGQKRKEKKKGAPRHVGKIKLTRKGKKGNTLDCGHLNVEYFLVHKNLATTSLPCVTVPAPYGAWHAWLGSLCVWAFLP